MKERPNQHARTANFEFDALRAANNYRRALIREFSPHLQGSVIEIGAGIGQTTELLRQIPAMKRLLCIEPDREFCHEFRTSLPGQPLVQGTVESLRDGQGWNAVVSINVLEHIREDERELARYRCLLRAEGGHLCLFVPARKEIYAPLDADFGHHRRYSKPELRQKLQNSGFEIVRLNYFNCVGYFAWWLSFCVLRKRNLDAGSVHFFDRIIFPLVYGLESRLHWPPFGQSLMAVARPR